MIVELFEILIINLKLEINLLQQVVTGFTKYKNSKDLSINSIYIYKYSLL